ncbi:hypothetical protein L2E82_25027 [Cichorium intybus]|uniref:Uncharacterized protein n=1 Tax=Cichorium intybus TaxID=13427 RepID=A0ACB9E214_CICIN|nr:hypothetical protein L2E82_25027 [Cichorium intybus]
MYTVAMQESSMDGDGGDAGVINGWIVIFLCEPLSMNTIFERYEEAKAGYDRLMNPTSEVKVLFYMFFSNFLRC